MYGSTTRSSDQLKTRYLYLVVIISVLTIASFTIYHGLQSDPVYLVPMNATPQTNEVMLSPPDIRKVTLVWEMTGCSCSGFQIEIVDTVLALYESDKLGRLAIMAAPNCWCDGFPQDVVETLEFLRQQPYHEWDIDIFVRHTHPSAYVQWPHKGIKKRPKVVVGRSMVEIDVVDEPTVQRISLVDAVWTPSQHSLEAFVKRGALREKFSIVHEPINASLYDPSKAQPLPLEGLRGFNFLSVFKWEARKGIDVLLRAFFEEFSEQDDVSLIVSTYLFRASEAYCPDTIHEMIKLFVQELGLDKRPNALPLDRVVVISEHLPLPDMLRLQKTADAFVLPTRGEGWGLPVIEAMAMGKPTIATDYSGIHEFLTEEVGFPIRTRGLEPATGYCFEPWMRWASVDVAHLRELMRRVFSMDRQQREELGQRARQHVIKNFSRAAIAAQVHQRVEELMVKFNLPGSAPTVCAKELSAERARARRLGVLGTQAGKEAPEDLHAYCSVQGMQRYYRKWDGHINNQYQLWPTTHEVDVQPSNLFDVSDSIDKKRRTLVKGLQDVSYMSARAVYLASLPPSHTPSAADVVPWEVRKQKALKSKP